MAGFVGNVVTVNSLTDTNLYEVTGGYLYRGFFIHINNKDTNHPYVVNHYFIKMVSSNIEGSISHIDELLSKITAIQGSLYIKLGNKKYQDQSGRVYDGYTIEDGRLVKDVDVNPRVTIFYHLGSYYSTDFPMKLSMRGKIGKMISPSSDYLQLGVM